MSHLFGTDGIRGRASRYPMDAETVMKVGRAAALEMGRNAGSAAKAVIGQDTRISGDMIAQAVAASLARIGIDICQPDFLASACLFSSFQHECRKGFFTRTEEQQTPTLGRSG